MNLRITAAAIALALLCGCAAKPNSPSNPTNSTASQAVSQAESLTIPPLSENPSLSNFKTIDLNGDEVSQQIFSDYKLTLINVWATFCQPCLQEMPDLAELSEEYQSKGVQIIGVIGDLPDGSAEQVSTARTIVEKTGANYPHLLPSPDLLASGLLSSQAVPATLFVDSTGKAIGKGYLGARSKSEWQQIIEEKLLELESTSPTAEVAS